MVSRFLHRFCLVQQIAAFYDLLIANIKIVQTYVANYEKYFSLTLRCSFIICS